MMLSFKAQFVPAVQDGTKPHTIRAGRRWQVGMGIQFYENARQPTMRKFRADAVATVVQRIVIEMPVRLPGVAVYVDGRPLSLIECETLAHGDGFESARDLVQWFQKTHSLPFEGQLICWTDLRY